VQVNRARPVAIGLNWSEVAGHELATVTLDMDDTVELAIIDGSIALDAFGFVVLAGTFDLVKQTNVAIDDGAGPVASFNAVVLSLSLTVSGFCRSGWSVEARSTARPPRS
jgi:hypothetical protein